MALTHSLLWMDLGPSTGCMARLDLQIYYSYLWEPSTRLLLFWFIIIFYFILTNNNVYMLWLVCEQIQTRTSWHILSSRGSVWYRFRILVVLLAATAINNTSMNIRRKIVYLCIIATWVRTCSALGFPAQLQLLGVHLAFWPILELREEVLAVERAFNVGKEFLGGR